MSGLVIDMWIMRRRNPNRVKAEEFLAWAKTDLQKNKEPRSRANALGNIKRAVHARLDDMMRQLRVEHSNDWKGYPTTDDKLAVLAKLDVGYRAIVQVLTDIRNRFEHDYLVPNVKTVEAHLESAELWLEKARSFHRPAIVIAGLQTRNFGVQSGPKGTTFKAEYTQPSKVTFFWDPKKMIVVLNKDGTREETPYSQLGWKDLVRQQKALAVSNSNFTVPQRTATGIFKHYERWLKRQTSP